MRRVHGPGEVVRAVGRVGRRARRASAAERSGVASASGVRRHNLPVPVTSFVGRGDALDTIDRLLAGTRLLSLTGVGGVGKTRLALQAAGRLVDAYPDGVWLVELAGLTEPGPVPRVVASALGLQLPHTTPIRPALVAALESRELLLVLDNCEHLLDACAELVDRLLRGCPGLRVLVTSREPLGIAGETVWRVPGLGLRSVGTGPRLDGVGRIEASPEASEAVQLFLERARAARPELETGEHTLAAAVEICRRLDGLPLAIELAAARVSLLSATQIAARLDDRFRLLTSGNRSGWPRHQTLRAMVDWSYDLLASEEQTALRRLAVFAGGWTLEDAERVASSELRVASADPHHSLRATHYSLLDTLARLTAKSLVLADEQGGEVRYRLLDTIRAYALEKLVEAGEADDARDRHLDWLLALAERAEPHLQGTDQVRWLARLEAESGNLRAALSWACSQDRIEAGLRLGRALWPFWRARGHLVEGRTWLEALLTHAVDAPSALLELRADVAVRAGNLSLERGDPRRAWTHLEWALDVARSLGASRCAADALTQLGHAARQERRWAEARALYLESLQLRRAASDRLGEMWALGSLGHLALAEGDLAEARVRYQAGLHIARQLDNAWEVATFLRLLGKQASDAADWPTAYGYYAESLRQFRRIGDQRSAIAAVEGIAGVAAARGRVEIALQLAGAAEIARQTLDVPLSPHDVARVERQLLPAREALGPRRSAALFADGQTMPLEQAVAVALDPGLAGESVCTVPQPSGTSAHAAVASIATVASVGAGSALGADTRLTRREREVALLVARGYNNPRIGAELSVTRRTVEAHVTAILGKLGLTSRTELAVWAVEHGLRRRDDP
ncbi:MAG: LuxR C-terminal-related transcriptional regulator [Chloroflexota bacterium]